MNTNPTNERIAVLKDNASLSQLEDNDNYNNTRLIYTVTTYYTCALATMQYAYIIAYRHTITLLNLLCMTFLVSECFSLFAMLYRRADLWSVQEPVSPRLAKR